MKALIKIIKKMIIILIENIVIYQIEMIKINNLTKIKIKHGKSLEINIINIKLILKRSKISFKMKQNLKNMKKKIKMKKVRILKYRKQNQIKIFNNLEKML